MSTNVVIMHPIFLEAALSIETPVCLSVCLSVCPPGVCLFLTRKEDVLESLKLTGMLPVSHVICKPVLRSKGQRSRQLKDQKSSSQGHHIIYSVN